TDPTLYRAGWCLPPLWVSLELRQILCSLTIFSLHRRFSRSKSIIANVPPPITAPNLSNSQLALAPTRHEHRSNPIAELAAPPDGAYLPRFRALALFGRRPPERGVRSSFPASENLHMNGHLHCGKTARFFAV